MTTSIKLTFQLPIVVVRPIAKPNDIIKDDFGDLYEVVSVDENYTYVKGPKEPIGESFKGPNGTIKLSTRILNSIIKDGEVDIIKKKDLLHDACQFAFTRPANAISSKT